MIEVTVAVVGERGRLTALDPSLTIVSGGDVLSLEEKFQGGTGVNITPPPPSLVPTETLATAKRRIARAADASGRHRTRRVRSAGSIRRDGIVNAPQQRRGRRCRRRRRCPACPRGSRG